VRYTVKIEIFRVEENTSIKPGSNNREVTTEVTIVTSAQSRMAAMNKAIRLVDCEREDGTQ